MPTHRRDRDRRKSRRASDLDPKPRLLVVCEGLKTEPSYLTGFREACRNPRVDVHVVSHRGGSPTRLLEQAESLRDEARKKAWRLEDPAIAYDQVWCVFDVDVHGAEVPNVRRKAEAAGIELAVSNPCFELWLILHFRGNPGRQERDWLHREMKSYVKSYDKKVDFADYVPGYAEAVKRAEALSREAARAGESGRNPTTGVYRLTRAIEAG